MDCGLPVGLAAVTIHVSEHIVLCLYLIDPLPDLSILAKSRNTWRWTGEATSIHWVSSSSLAPFLFHSLTLRDLQVFMYIEAAEPNDLAVKSKRSSFSWFDDTAGK